MANCSPVVVMIRLFNSGILVAECASRLSEDILIEYGQLLLVPMANCSPVAVMIRPFGSGILAPESVSRFYKATPIGSDLLFLALMAV